MGVATYKTAADMPEDLRKALPDLEDLKRIISDEAMEKQNISITQKNTFIKEEQIMALSKQVSLQFPNKKKHQDEYGQFK